MCVRTCVCACACVCALGHDWLDCLGVADSGETTIRGGDLPMSGVGGGDVDLFWGSPALRIVIFGRSWGDGCEI